MCIRDRIAQELNESLCKGESFENTLHTPYVEHALQQFFQIADVYKRQM